MATGYTAAIEKGIGFEAFVMRCARSIGHLVGLRDMSLDAPIPERLEPSTYHSDMLAQASDRLARLMGMGSEEAEQEAAKQDVKRSQSNTKHAKDQEVLLAKYRRMLDMVQAWQPPSDDHVVLKKFMVQQLEDSIGFDSETSMPYTRPRQTGKKWLADAKEVARADIKYHRRAHALELKRVRAANVWLRQLRESLKDADGTRADVGKG